MALMVWQNIMFLTEASYANNSILTILGVDSFLFFLRFADTLEQAEDMAIDIPHIWLYLAELLTPVLREGGFSMRELFRYNDCYFCQ